MRAAPGAWRVFWTLSLAFSAAYPVCVVGHEFGHVLGGWLQRNPQLGAWRVHIDPLGVSYAAPEGYYSALSGLGQCIILAGGVSGGGALALAMAGLAGRLRGVARLFLLQGVACGCMLNGLYLAMALGMPWGDAKSMLDLYAPAWALLGASVPLLAGWLWANALLCRELDLDRPERPWRAWVAALAGTGVFPALIVGRQALDPTQGDVVPLEVFVVYALLVEGALALALIWARLQPSRPRRLPGWLVTGGLAAGFVLFMGAGLRPIAMLEAFERENAAVLGVLVSRLDGLPDQILAESTGGTERYRKGWSEARVAEEIRRRARAMLVRCGEDLGGLPPEIESRLWDLLEFNAGLLLMRLPEAEAKSGAD